MRGVALSGIAAEGLENGSGIASRTIASLEHGWAQGRDLLGPRDVLVIDEAGMVGTRQMERVFSHAADAGAKVVLVGDPQQLQAIEAGAAVPIDPRATRRRRDHRGAPPARGAGRAKRRANLPPVEPRMRFALTTTRGMVHAAETREAARVELIERWDRDRQATLDASRIILTHTNAEVRELNEGARAAMRASGDLGGDVRIKTERGDRDFAAGDRIMFLRNERSLEVKNGTLGTIERASESSMAVRTDDGRSVAFDTKAYRDLDHGYAATIHKAQGDDGQTGRMCWRRLAWTVTAPMSRCRVIATACGAPLWPRRLQGSGQACPHAVARAGQGYGDRITPRPIQRAHFAERRGITLGERVAEIVKAVPEKAQGMFDGLRLSLGRPDREATAPERERSIFADFRPTPRSHEPDRSDQFARDAQSMRAGGVRGAVERYAKALDAVQQTRAQGLEAMPHQRVALDRAKEMLDAIRPHASTDLGAALPAPAGACPRGGGRAQPSGAQGDEQGSGNPH